VGLAGCSDLSLSDSAIQKRQQHHQPTNRHERGFEGEGAHFGVSLAGLSGTSVTIIDSVTEREVPDGVALECDRLLSLFAPGSLLPALRRVASVEGWLERPQQAADANSGSERPHAKVIPCKREVAERKVLHSTLDLQRLQSLR
jgi:hypothetical protein